MEDAAPRNAVLPNWPRMLSAEMAAAYVGVGKTTFLREVGEKIWPAADRRGGRVMWDRRLLDLAQDRRSGLTADVGRADPAKVLEELGEWVP